MIFEVMNSLVACIGYGEMAKENLDSSHPAFSHVVTALQAAERARTGLEEFARGFRRQRREAEAGKGEQATPHPSAKNAPGPVGEKKPPKL
jgi:hypothetical protein